MMYFENEIDKMLMEICLLTEIPRYTDHCLRSMAIAMLKGSGFEDRDICKLSGHVSVDSLNHYNASISLGKNQNMTQALLLVPKLKYDEKEKDEPSPKRPPAPASATIISGQLEAMLSDVPNSPNIPKLPSSTFVPRTSIASNFSLTQCPTHD